jgi:hypothetical protein
VKICKKCVNPAPPVGSGFCYDRTDFRLCIGDGSAFSVLAGSPKRTCDLDFAEREGTTNGCFPSINQQIVILKVVKGHLIGHLQIQPNNANSLLCKIIKFVRISQKEIRQGDN